MDITVCTILILWWEVRTKHFHYGCQQPKTQLEYSQTNAANVRYPKNLMRIPRQQYKRMFWLNTKLNGCQYLMKPIMLQYNGVSLMEVAFRIDSNLQFLLMIELYLLILLD